MGSSFRCESQSQVRVRSSKEKQRAIHARRSLRKAFFASYDDLSLSHLLPQFQDQDVLVL